MLKIEIPAFQRPVFSTQLKVRISDINYGNHLGHDALISMLHEARVRFLHQFGFSELNTCGLGMLITSLSINYVNQVFYAEEILFEIGVGDKSRTKIEIIYKMSSVDKRKPIANALTTIAFYDFEKKRIKEIPAKFLTALEIKKSETHQVRKPDRETRQVLVNDLMRISQRCSALPDQNKKPTIEIINYDKHGVPK